MSDKSKCVSDVSGQNAGTDPSGTSNVLSKSKNMPYPAAPAAPAASESSTAQHHDEATANADISKSKQNVAPSNDKSAKPQDKKNQNDEDSDGEARNPYPLPAKKPKFEEIPRPKWDSSTSDGSAIEVKPRLRPRKRVQKKTPHRRPLINPRPNKMKATTKANHSKHSLDTNSSSPQVKRRCRKPVCKCSRCNSLLSIQSPLSYGYGTRKPSQIRNKRSAQSIATDQWIHLAQKYLFDRNQIPTKSISGEIEKLQFNERFNLSLRQDDPASVDVKPRQQRKRALPRYRTNQRPAKERHVLRCICTQCEIANRKKSKRKPSKK